MKFRIGLFLILLSLCLIFVCACNSAGGAETGDSTGVDTTETPSDDNGASDVYIHSFAELNSKEHELDSHAADYTKSKLEMDYRSFDEYQGIRANGIDGYYSRVKKLNDGRYMLIFHNGQYGGSVYVAFGKDVNKFGAPIEIFGKVQLDGEKKLYMTPDAEQMPNGRIIATAGYRSTSNYAGAIAKNGIVVRYSDDGGKTWSEQSTVYVGTNWEPSLLVTGDQEVKLFFTSTAPTIELYGFNNRSGIVGMITSKDNGVTWTPNITSSPWKAQIVAVRYLGMQGNVMKMTDQMPVATILNNGTTALALEEQINDAFSLAFAYSNNAFTDVNIELGQSGPTDVIHTIFKGAGPYIRQFPSGETVLTYHWANTFRYRLGDATARRYNPEVTLWDNAGHWGSVEIDTGHSAIMTIGKSGYGLYIARTHLNHKITAAKETPTVDGNGADWQGDEAWFVGSESQAQMSVRVAHDDSKIYLLAERLDQYVNSNDGLTVYLGDTTADGYYNIKITQDGTVSARRYSAETQRFQNVTLDGITVSTSVVGTLEENSDKDTGVVFEIAIDKSLTVVGTDGSVFLTVSLQNRDSGNGKLTTDTIEGVDLAKKSTWIPVVLG